MNIEYVCVSITNQCNLSCEYCYRLGSSVDYISTDCFINCLSKLKKLGCKKINISGGEPLLHPCWREYIRISCEMGFSVFLSTNGILLDINDPILNLIDKLIIPLDASTNSINSKYRGKQQFISAFNIIREYKIHDYSFKLKINTVMTRDNLLDLSNMIPILN